MKLFISYRRQDSTVITGRIYDRLISAFGDRAVFRDIDDIPAGKDFRAVLENEVGKSNVMLVIIGPQWTNIVDVNGKKRLFDPNDFVRIEVESGLKNKDILVIPVLALGASMPTANELPESLHELTYRNAVSVRNDPDFYHDMERLIRQIKGTEPITQRIAPKLGIGAVAILIMTFLIFAGIRIFGNSSEQNNTTPSATVPDFNFESTATTSANGVSEISVNSGFGARANGWQLYFTNPANNQNPTTLVDTSKLINTTIIASRGISLYQEPNQDSSIITRVAANEKFLVRAASDDKLWLYVQLQDKTEGWMLTEDVSFVSATPIAPINTNQYGINIRLVDAIGRVRNTLDIAAYVLDEKEITKAILDAQKNGVIVRIVTDDEYGLGDPENTFQQFIDAGIQVVADERSALMHDKFMILDGKTVWTGSWNYTEHGTFESNDNALAFDSAEVAAIYQDEFNQMFEQYEFSPNAPASLINKVTVSGIPVEIYFSPHDEIDVGILDVIRKAQKSIHFLTFSFTDNDFGALFLERLSAGVKVMGVFEKTTSSSYSSELSPLFCANAEVRTDGSKYFLHHKVIIVDEAVVITGSANYSLNALTNNNENTIIVYDPILASVYMQEFERQWAVAQTPTDITCP